MLLLYISKAGQISNRRTIAEGAPILVTGNNASGATAFDVVHQVMSKLSGGIGEPGREFRGSRIQEDSRGFKCRSAQEKERRLKFQRRSRLRIDDADTADAS